tara:strand:- start:240 stop:515 length:276 start_codon:yes stop_codon:yes gene_type:complete
MKTHKTETLETAPSFRARFAGAFAAGKRIKPEINLIGERHSNKGRWKAAQLAWYKIQQGKIQPHSRIALELDHADKFAYFRLHGGRLPMGL